MVAVRSLWYHLSMCIEQKLYNPIIVANTKLYKIISCHPLRQPLCRVMGKCEKTPKAWGDLNVPPLKWANLGCQLFCSKHCPCEHPLIATNPANCYDVCYSSCEHTVLPRQLQALEWGAFIFHLQVCIGVSLDSGIPNLCNACHDLEKQGSWGIRKKYPLR